MLDLSGQQKVLKKIGNYAFDRVSNLKPIRRVDLSGNGIEMIGDLAFCSRNYLRPYANVKEIDLRGNYLKKLNACVIRQLFKGYNSRAILRISSASNETLLDCDCEVTRSSKLIDLHGSCRLNQIIGLTSTIDLNKYECGSDFSTRTLNQLHAHCQAMATQYECSQSPDLDFNPAVFIHSITTTITTKKVIFIN